MIRHDAARSYKQVLYTKHRQWHKHHLLKFAHKSEGIYRVAVITFTIWTCRMCLFSAAVRLSLRCLAGRPLLYHRAVGPRTWACIEPIASSCIQLHNSRQTRQASETSILNRRGVTPQQTPYRAAYSKLSRTRGISAQVSWLAGCGYLSNPV